EFEKYARAEEAGRLVIDLARLARGPAGELAPGAQSLVALYTAQLTAKAIAAEQAKDALTAAVRRGAAVGELVKLNLDLIDAASRQAEAAAGLSAYTRALAALTP